MEDRRRARGVLLLLCLAIFISGCDKRAHNEAEAKAIARHDEEAKVRLQFRKMLRSPDGMKIMGGVRLLQTLAEHGLLPGFDGKPPRGVSLDPPSVNPEGPYYLTETFYLGFGDPPQRYVYVVAQTYSNGGFQLLKAWRAGDGGKNSEQFVMSPPPPMAVGRPCFVGPANPGAELAQDKWFFGATGGTAEINTNDPATGFSCFRLAVANSPTGQTNRADFRSESFPLNGAGKLFRPLTFSFAYKLPEQVKAGDDIILFFRFFGPKPDDFIDQETVSLGSSSGDSEMARYKTMTLANMSVPRQAVAADIWVTANTFGPWTSGAAQFDDFAVTTTPAWPWQRVYVGGGIGAGIGILVGGIFLWRRKHRTAN